MALERSGNLAGAEAKYIAALEAKIKGAGVNSSQAALSSNALGELYLKMGKLEEAKDLLEHAEKVRSGMSCVVLWFLGESRIICPYKERRRMTLGERRG